MDPKLDNVRFTLYGWFMCLWILVMTFQYGYHISVLNQIQKVLTCEVQSENPVHHAIPTCIPMSKSVFSAVTAVFTLGGLVGSAVANIFMDKRGRRGATCISGICTTAGAGLMAASSSVLTLGFGRFLVGVGSGIGICVAPVFLAEIAPPKIRGSVGVLTQLGIVLGIFTTQAFGLKYATPTHWRIVLVLSSLFSVGQLVSSIFAAESPVWLGNHGHPDTKKAVHRRIWAEDASLVGDSAADPLLDNAEARRDSVPAQDALTVPQLLFSPEMRKPLAIVCLAMISQQFSGINAVLYYSNDILSKALPDTGAYVSLGIATVNVLMTFPPIILIERLGRRKLLVLSAAGALISLVGVGLGLDSGGLTLPSITIVTFVMSFAIGLGPVPFVMLPEVSPSKAVSAMSSVALSFNWIVNFFVGLTFIPLRSLLSGGDASKEGRVFYVFGAILFVSMYSLTRLYRG